MYAQKRDIFQHTCNAAQIVKTDIGITPVLFSTYFPLKKLELIATKIKHNKRRPQIGGPKIIETEYIIQSINGHNVVNC